MKDHWFEMRKEVETTSFGLGCITFGEPLGCGGGANLYASLVSFAMVEMRGVELLNLSAPRSSAGISFAAGVAALRLWGRSE